MKRRLLPVGVLVLVALTASPLQAASEGPALSPFAGNLGNAIWTLAIFAIVVIVLGKFAWGPVLGLLRQREEFIHSSLSEAKRDREEAEAKLDVLDRLPGCSVPLHVVGCAEDVQAPPQYGQRVAELAPTGVFHLLEGHGHCSLWSRGRRSGC